MIFCNPLMRLTAIMTVNQKYLEGLADKLRMLIFRCAAPLVSILFVFPTNIIATLWLTFQVQRTGNLCRIMPGSVFKGAAHRNI
jgi:hypothetical protein